VGNLERGTNMEIITIIGLVAAALSTTSLLPQLIRVWKTKSVKDLSAVMCGIMCTSVILWLTYGVLASDIPLMASNAMVFAQTVGILTLKAKYSPQPIGVSSFSAIASKLKILSSTSEQEAEETSGLPFLL